MRQCPKEHAVTRMQTLCLARRWIVLFGQSLPNVLRPPQLPAGSAPLPNMWIMMDEADANGLAIRPEARSSGVTCEYQKLMDIYNLDQIENPPVVPPAAVHFSYQSQRPYGANFQRQLSFIATKNKYISKWWISYGNMLNCRLTPRPRQMRHSLTFPAVAKFYHISHLVDPEQLRTWPISGKSGHLYPTKTTGPRIKELETLRSFQKQHGFSTGLFYSAKGLRECFLKVKNGETGCILGSDDQSSTTPKGDDSSLSAAPAAQLPPQLSSPVQNADNTHATHWYNSEDVLFPVAYEIPIVSDTYLGVVPIDGATGLQLVNPQEVPLVPMRGSHIWFEAKYLLKVGAKVKVNCLPFVQRKTASATNGQYEMFNADQVENADAAFRLCGTGYNISSRRSMAMMSSASPQVADDAAMMPSVKIQ